MRHIFFCHLTSCTWTRERARRRSRCRRHYRRRRWRLRQSRSGGWKPLREVRNQPGRQRRGPPPAMLQSQGLNQTSVASFLWMRGVIGETEIILHHLFKRKRAKAKLNQIETKASFFSSADKAGSTTCQTKASLDIFLEVQSCVKRPQSQGSCLRWPQGYRTSTSASPIWPFTKEIMISSEVSVQHLIILKPHLVGLNTIHDIQAITSPSSKE